VQNQVQQILITNAMVTAGPWPGLHILHSMMCMQTCRSRHYDTCKQLCTLTAWCAMARGVKHTMPAVPQMINTVHPSAFISSWSWLICASCPNSAAASKGGSLLTLCMDSRSLVLCIECREVNRQLVYLILKLVSLHEQQCVPKTSQQQCRVLHEWLD